jgi:protein tyrosine phosphatase (PTP) superfamily phosphohydrolase (DUF442 family)
VSEPVSWGAAESVTRVSRLWFAGQPDPAGFEAARDSGVGLVINLREPDELDWDEAAAVESLGMSYASVPIPRQGPLPASALEEIELLVKEHPDEQVLVHCASGQRAAGWLATHMVSRHGMETEPALDVARRAGMTSSGMEQRVRDYIER